MNEFLNRYSTPLTLGLFAVSTISGVALFLHVGQPVFHEMHEWLSMVLLLPFGFHVWKNWNPIVSYARRGWLVVPLVLSLLVAIPFAWPALSGTREGGSPSLPMRIMTKASLADLAPVLKTTPDALQAALAAKGWKAASPQDLIEKIAGPEARKALYAVLPK